MIALICNILRSGFFFQGVYNAYQTDTVSRFSLVRLVFPAVKAQTFFFFLFHHNLVNFLFDSDLYWHVLKPAALEHSGTPNLTVLFCFIGKVWGLL